MQGHEIPPGYALVRLSDLATHAGPPPPDPGLRRQPGDAWSGPDAAIAMLTAKPETRTSVTISSRTESRPSSS